MLEHDGFASTDTTQSFAHICPALGTEPATRSVTDSDEEIFLLYTLSAPSPGRVGLGQVDASHDSLHFMISLEAGSVDDIPAGLEYNGGQSAAKVSKRSGRHEKKRGVTSSGATEAGPSSIVQATIKQSSTSLRSTTGDTGSVVWRSTVAFATKVLQDTTVEERQRERSDPGVRSTSLLSTQALRSARVLELGAGTGILPALILRHPLFATASQTHWTATDQGQIEQLLWKNVEPVADQGRRASVRVVDWLEASKLYRNGPDTTSALAYIRSILQVDFTSSEEVKWPQVLMATDCIFNPHLFDPFLDTMTLFSQPGHTLAVVVCELRQADMMHDFLKAWLDHPGGWTIRTVEDAAFLGPVLARGSVVWVGWRTSNVSSSGLSQ